MLLFIAETLGIAFLFVMGLLAFTKPYQLLGFQGTPEQIGRYTLRTKRLGVLIMVCSGVMFFCLVTGQFAGG
jgi:hypothetical protein